MESLDLLAREDEFKKLNKQLEKKTESLMKEIEHVMQKQDFFSDFSHSLSITPHSTPKKHLQPALPQDTPTVIPKPVYSKKKISRKHLTVDETKNEEIKTDKIENQRVTCDYCENVKRSKKSDDAEFLQAFVAVGVQEKVFPQVFLKDNISVENICKFLSSKVKLLQEQIDRLQATLDRKALQCKAHLTQQAELEGERMTLLNRNNNLKAAAADARAKSAALEHRLAEKDRLYKEQRSECDKLTCELKRLRGDMAGIGSRHAAHEETISNLSQQLKTLKIEYADFRDSTRRLSSSHQNAISCLEARTKGLTSTIDKQTALIDNLRKQNAVLATESALRVLEKEYCYFLDQDL